MTPDEMQLELGKCREIIFAAIDYTIEKEAGKLQSDQIEYSGNFHRLWKEQVEKQYQDHHLDKLKKSLETVTLNYKITGDLDFVKYIKEKTGYDFDLFGNIRERIDKIIARGWVANRKEAMDMDIMIQLYRKTGVGQENAHVLRNLLMAFQASERKKKKPEEDIFPAINVLCEINSPDNKRYVSMYESHFKDTPATYVNIHFENGIMSGVYTVEGINLGITINWKDNHTILVKIKKEGTVFIKYNLIQDSGDRIQVVYAEN